MKKACILLLVLNLILGFIITYYNIRSIHIVNAPLIDYTNDDVVNPPLNDVWRWLVSNRIYAKEVSYYAQHQNLLIIAGVGYRDWKLGVCWSTLFVYNSQLKRWEIKDAHWAPILLNWQGYESR